MERRLKSQGRLKKERSVKEHKAHWSNTKVKMGKGHLKSGLYSN